MNLDQLLSQDILPDWLIRRVIRQFLSEKLKKETEPILEKQQEKLMAFVNELKQSPIAIEEKAANEQHYEVPSTFFVLALGPRLKYSCALWEPQTKNLAEAEELMLELYCKRAELQDGMRILELGCGWGSLSFYMAEKYPNAKITVVSNSKTQKLFIDELAQLRGMTNLEVITANMVNFNLKDYPHLEPVDRIVSIEMMEHMKNYQALFHKIATWLKPDGKLFVHIFTHERLAYHYEDVDEKDWMTRYFFSGGTMPSTDLFHYFQDDLLLEAQWAVNGTHYEKTANAWIENMERNKARIMPLLAETYGSKEAKKWWMYWKVFFMACAELWGYAKGNEWQVTHYRFAKRNH